MMGIGLLLIVGLAAWWVYSQRESLDLVGHRSEGMYASRSMGDTAPIAGTVENDAPEQMARRRYANGEIDENEYRAIISTLRSR